jgi:ABC-2 type transport system permease protein
MSMRQWLSNIYRLGLKELASLAGDTVLVAFIVYSFSFSVYKVATNQVSGVENATVAIVDGDHSVLSARIRAAFLPPYFRSPVLLDRMSVDPAMDRGERTFVLDVPPDFEADVLRGRQTALQLNIDATAMTQAGIGAGYIEAIVRQETTDFLRARGIEAGLPVRPVIRAFFNPNLDAVWFQGVMAVIQNITLLSILITGAAVIREREHGTIEHLLVMPVRASEIALAKIWANGLVILVAAALSLTLVVEWALKVPIEGSITLFLVGTAAYLFATTSLGILIATVARSMPQFSLLAIPVFLVLNMLSGATSPLESMPRLLQIIVEASPAVHFVKFAQAVLYRAAGWDVVWPQVLVLGGLGSIFLGVALARFRSMLAQEQR